MLLTAAMLIILYLLLSFFPGSRGNWRVC